VSKFAQNTSVSVEKSKAEIERLLVRYGATAFIQGHKERQAFIGFQANGKTLRFILPLPSKESEEFTLGRWGKERIESHIYRLWEQACRQKWRALTLVIKAKLEAVEFEITSFEDEFMAHIVMPNGQTVGEWIKPHMERFPEKKMPPLLPGLQ